MAARRVPRAVFDYVDGGAGDEISLARARTAFSRVEFHPKVLRDVSQISLSTTILGEDASLPLVLAPTGFTRMMHHSGERAVAAAAARAGVPYALSTAGTTSPEDLMTVVPSGVRWFQLYLWRDRGRAKALVDRVAEAGFRTLVLTVDTPAAGDRRRDVRNGLEIPPALRLGSVIEGAIHPRWWFDFLTTEPIRFAAQTDPGETLQDVFGRMFNPTVTVGDVAWLRERWTGTLVVKGVSGRTTPRSWPRSVWMDSRCRTMAGGNSIGRCLRSTCCLRSWTRSANGLRSCWTEGFGRGRTSSRPWAWAPGRCSRGVRISMG
jgi:L-lactate dehydrogenase (cytochrome)